MSDLNRKVALVSGAARGIGAAIAQTISRLRAVGSIGRLRTAGFPAWLLWLPVHLVWLTGFKNRVLVLAHWTTAFVSRGRAERATTEQQVFGRQALAASAPGRRGR